MSTKGATVQPPGAKAAGLALGLAMLSMIPAEWLGLHLFAMVAAICLFGFLLWAWRWTDASRKLFLIIAALLVIASLLTKPEPLAAIVAASRQAAFITAFFIAQATLRHAALSSAAIERCGHYLASQPPGRRYLALTAGGHLFGLILSYGAISLLGGLAEVSARRESDAAIRALRIRRMLLAVQRGFVSTLAWSPLAFSYAVATSIIEGSSWSGAVMTGATGAIILACLGWAMDRVVKPPARPAGRRPVAGNWRDTLPLLLLLAIIMGGVGLLQWLSGVRTVGVVLLAVPLVSLIWLALQAASRRSGEQRRDGGLAVRVTDFVYNAIPGYRSELVLVSMAAFIGSMGSSFILFSSGGEAGGLADVPSWIILTGLVTLVPAAGLLGMNPILSVTLFLPLLPPPDILGISPDIIVAAITAGWALSGAISPFTATTLIVGSIAGVSAWRVGLNWNGGYTLIAGILLSLSVVLFSFWS